MRLFPLLTAALVTAALYLIIFERDRVLGFAGATQPAPDTAAEATADSAADGAADPAAEPNGGIRRVAVVGLRSEARVVESAVLVRGRTEAAREVSVMAETSGRVITAPLRRGAAIAEGQALCTLDPGTRAAALAEAEARLAEAEARLAEAEINDRAARALSRDGFASETRVAATAAAVKAARAGLQSAEASVAAAETEIGRLTIAAPFAGILESDTAELGTLLQPGAPCARILQLDPIKLVGFLPETEVERARVGAAAGARLASGREVAGTVTFLSRSADPATRTFRVEVEVPNPDLAIRDGQTIEIAISAAGERAHLLPASALTLDDSGALGVRIAEGGVARFVPVTLLRDTVAGVWLAGLPELADVIVVGQEFVTDGVPVDVTLREGAAP